MKARHVFAKDAVRTDGAPRAEHLFVIDELGRLLERFSDMPEGQWSEIPLPRSPAKRQRRIVRKTRRL